jgi:hypothetical protein
MTRYYKIDIRRMPFGLLWRWGYRLKLVVWLWRRVLPISWWGTTLVPHDGGVTSVTDEEVDPELREVLVADVAYLSGEGFRSVTHYVVPTLGPSKGLGHLMLSRDGATAALCVTARAGFSSDKSISLVSRRAGVRLIATGSKMRPLPPLPDVDGLNLPGAPADVVLSRHLSRLASEPLVPFREAELVPLILDLQARARDYYVAIRLYVPANDQDVAIAERHTPPRARITTRCS